MSTPHEPSQCIQCSSTSYTTYINLQCSHNICPQCILTLLQLNSFKGLITHDHIYIICNCSPHKNQISFDALEVFLSDAFGVDLDLSVQQPKFKLLKQQFIDQLKQDYSTKKFQLNEAIQVLTEISKEHKEKYDKFQKKVYRLLNIMKYVMCFNKTCDIERINVDNKDKGMFLQLSSVIGNIKKKKGELNVNVHVKGEFDLFKEMKVKYWNDCFDVYSGVLRRNARSKGELSERKQMKRNEEMNYNYAGKREVFRIYDNIVEEMKKEMRTVVSKECFVEIAGQVHKINDEHIENDNSENKIVVQDDDIKENDTVDNNAISNRSKDDNNDDNDGLANNNSNSNTNINNANIVNTSNVSVTHNVDFTFPNAYPKIPPKPTHPLNTITNPIHISIQAPTVIPSFNNSCLSQSTPSQFHYEPLPSFLLINSSPSKPFSFTISPSKPSADKRTPTKASTLHSKPSSSIPSTKHNARSTNNPFQVPSHFKTQYESSYSHGENTTSLSKQPLKHKHKPTEKQITPTKSFFPKSLKNINISAHIQPSKACDTISTEHQLTDRKNTNNKCKGKRCLSTTRTRSCDDNNNRFTKHQMSFDNEMYFKSNKSPPKQHVSTLTNDIPKIGNHSSFVTKKDKPNLEKVLSPKQNEKLSNLYKNTITKQARELYDKLLKDETKAQQLKSQTKPKPKQTITKPNPNKTTALP